MYQPHSTQSPSGHDEAVAALSALVAHATGEDRQRMQALRPAAMLAQDTTPFLASTMPLTNPFAHHPHNGAFQPLDGPSRVSSHPSRSWSHDLSGVQHSSEAALTRVSLPSSLYASHTMPILPSLRAHEPSVPLFRSTSEQVTATSSAPPVYQDEPQVSQPLLPSSSSYQPSLGPAAQYREQRRVQRQEERRTLGVFAGITKDNVQKVFSHLDDRSLILAGAACRRFRSVHTSDKLWSPRVTALRRVLRGHSMPLPPRTNEPQWQQHGALVTLVAMPAIRRRSWGDIAVAVLADDVQLLDVLLHLGFGQSLSIRQRVHLLHNAVRCDYVAIAMLLLQRAGGELERRALLGGLDGDGGRTALHYARSQGMVRGLLAHGADMHAVDAFGVCAAETAEALGLRRVALLLRGQQQGRRDVVQVV